MVINPPEEPTLTQVSHRKRLPALAPNRLLDIPRGAKLPLLPGSSTLFRSTHLGKQLYQPSSGFDLGEPFCQIMTTKYTSLHNPHLHSYYKSTDNLRRFKRGGYVTNENKKMFEKRVTKRQEPSLLPEGGDTCHFGEWLMQEESPDLHDPKGQMRNRDLDTINKELEKIKATGQENLHLQWAEEEKKQHSQNKKKQLKLRKKMEEAWKKKEMLLLLKIGDDVKRESRTEHLRRKNREEKAKKAPYCCQHHHPPTASTATLLSCSRHTTASMEPTQSTTAVVTALNTTRIIMHYMQNLQKQASR
ncbi:unnamed protein product [Lepidochelys olivacea]